MTDYIQLEFRDLAASQTELLIARLMALGFEGFEETENGLLAFIPVPGFDAEPVKEIAAADGLVFTQTLVKSTNWNAEWESSFQPVRVDDFTGIRADFHAPMTGVAHEIVITPKMSFGTGHHATTFMMIRQMEQIDFNGKRVLDFGTGTGILAILAEKLGAASVLAIDNDEWSISNAAENLERNNCSNIELKNSGTITGLGAFDIILANINKNVILENLPALAAQTLPGGILLLSGLLEEDEQVMLQAMAGFPLVLSKKMNNHKWISLRFTCK